MDAKRKPNDNSPNDNSPNTTNRPNKAVLAAIGMIHVAAAALTWRDLRHRPAGGVRGNKRAWRAASAVNTIGSAAYWLFGRRHRTA